MNEQMYGTLQKVQNSFVMLSFFFPPKGSVPQEQVKPFPDASLELDWESGSAKNQTGSQGGWIHGSKKRGKRGPFDVYINVHINYSMYTSKYTSTYTSAPM